jgi:uncharacterized membrane protein (Fun14 family)
MIRITADFGYVLLATAGIGWIIGFASGVAMMALRDLLSR